jgi:hypothetical protein
MSQNWDGWNRVTPNDSKWDSIPLYPQLVIRESGYEAETTDRMGAQFDCWTSRQYYRRKRPECSRYHLKFSCYTSPNFISQHPSANSFDRTQVLKIESRCQQFSSFRDIAESQHNIPLSINALARAFELNAHEVLWNRHSSMGWIHRDIEGSIPL